MISLSDNAAEQLWYPPQQIGFGPWVEHNGSNTLPVRNDAFVTWLTVTERKKQTFSAGHVKRSDWFMCAGTSVAAYAIKLPDPGEPTKEEVEQTQTPCTPEQYVADMIADEAAKVDSPLNDPMKGRDAEVKKAIAAAPKDEGWREYDPQYPPILPWPLEFDKRGSPPNERHYYRAVNKPDDDCDGLACIVAPIGQRVGGGRWGL